MARILYFYLDDSDLHLIEDVETDVQLRLRGDVFEHRVNVI